MLSFRTTATWVFTIEVGVPDLLGDVDTYVNASADNSAFDAVTAFCAWLNDAGARPWAGQSYTLGNIRDERGVGYTVTSAADTFEVNVDATATLRLNFVDTFAGVQMLSPEGKADGTWWPSGAPGIRGYVRRLDGAGAGCGNGVVRNGVAGLASRVPSVSSAATRQEAAELVALLPTCSVPRQAWAYHPQSLTWLLLSIGAVKFDQPDPFVTKITLEAMS